VRFFFRVRPRFGMVKVPVAAARQEREEGEVERSGERPTSLGEGLIKFYCDDAGSVGTQIRHGTVTFLRIQFRNPNSNKQKQIISRSRPRLGT
jgi:hypothetical protein